MIKQIKRAYFLFMLISITFVLFLILLIAAIPLRLFCRKKITPFSHWLGGIWSRLLFSAMPGWRLVVRGQEHLAPLNTATVMVANHQSLADIWVIYFLNRQFRWLSKVEVFKLPLIGHAMYMSGYIPITRGDKESHVAAYEQSKKVIAAGYSMFYFPEGTRSESGALLDFKVGAFRLAEECNVSVQPIVITGTKDLMRKGSLVPEPACVEIKVLPLAKQQAGESVNDFMQRVRASMQKELAVEESTANKKTIN